MTDETSTAVAATPESAAAPAPEVIASLAGGAIVLTKSNGVVTLSLSKSASVGGGEAAGLLQVQGEASAVLDAMTGVKLGEALINEHLPPAVEPLADVVEGVVNQAVSVILK